MKLFIFRIMTIQGTQHKENNGYKGVPPLQSHGLDHKQDEGEVNPQDAQQQQLLQLLQAAFIDQMKDKAMEELISGFMFHKEKSYKKCSIQKFNYCQVFSAKLYL